MAKYAIETPVKGSAGDLTYYVRNGKGYIRQRHNKVGSIKRNVNQMCVASQWDNAVTTYRVLSGDGGVSPIFPERRTGRTNYNEYMSFNLNQVAVFLPKDMAKRGACVVAPYHVSSGKNMHSIQVESKSGVNCTDIRIGDLMINSETTIGNLSKAIIDNNRHFKYGDSIFYFRAIQLQDHTGMPVVEGIQCAFELRENDTRKLYSDVYPEGFASVGSFLGAGSPVVGGECWVHVRYKGRVVVNASNQYLVCNNPLLAQYVTFDALKEAVVSHGGVAALKAGTSESDLDYELNLLAEELASHLKTDLSQSLPEGGTMGNNGGSVGGQAVITVVAENTAQGTVSGGGTYAVNSQVTLQATPKSGYKFTRWSDGSTQNPRAINVTGNATYQAQFDLVGGSGGSGGYDSGN